MNLNERCTRAEIAIREACADFAAEIYRIHEIEDLNAIAWKLRELERYLETVTNAATDKAERVLASR
jgi:hypothetical protein